MPEKVSRGLSERLAAERWLSSADADRLASLPQDDSEAWISAAVSSGLLTRWQAQRLASGKGGLSLADFVLRERIPLVGATELYLARPLKGGPDQWIEVGATENSASGAAAPGIRPAQGVIEQGRKSIVLHGPVDGTVSSALLKKGVRWGRSETAQLIRDVSAALAVRHASGKAWGRVAPTSFVRRGESWELAAWGTSDIDRRSEDSHTAPETVGTSGTPAGDLFGLGSTALLLLFGTTSAAKVQPRSRLDQVILKLVSPDPAARGSAQRCFEAISEWIASKQGEGEGTKPATDATDESPQAASAALATPPSTTAAPSTSPVQPMVSVEVPTLENPVAAVAELPEALRELAGPRVEALPTIHAETRFQVEPGSVPATQVKLRPPELPRRSVVPIVVFYSTVGIVTLVMTVLGVRWVLQKQARDLAAASAKPTAAKKEKPAEVPTETPVEPAVITDAPAPLVVIEEESTPAARPATPAAGLGLGNLSRPAPVNPVAPQPQPETPVAPVPPNMVAGEGDGPMPDPTMPNETEPMPAPQEQPEVAVVPPPMEQPTPPTTAAPETILPVFQDLPKAVDLPIVGVEGWTNAVVFGPIHLQPKDLLFTELKGASKAYRDKVTFTITAADGGTATDAFEVQVVEGDKRSRIGRFEVADGQLQFRFDEAAADVPAANFLRNCYLNLRTGTDVGGVALRRPIRMEGLTLDEKRLVAEASLKLDHLPDMASIQYRVLPLPENFPEYGFRDAKPQAPVNGGQVDVIFGGKYAEALFLRFQAVSRRGLELKVDPFAITDRRPRPFKADEIAGNLEQIQRQVQLLTNNIAAAEANIPALPEPQRPIAQEQIGGLRGQLNQAQELQKNLSDTMEFVGKLKNQVLPFAVYYMADEYKVYLASPSGEPLD